MPGSEGPENLWFKKWTLVWPLVWESKGTGCLGSLICAGPDYDWADQLCWPPLAVGRIVFLSMATATRGLIIISYVFEFLECLSAQDSMQSNTISSLASHASLVVHLSQGKPTKGLFIWKRASLVTRAGSHPRDEFHHAFTWKMKLTWRAGSSCSNFFLT
jgi:hypothetical protein